MACFMYEIEEDKMLTFQKHYSCGEKKGETETYDERRMFNWLSVNYCPATAKSVMDGFKRGTKREFVAWWGRFEVVETDQSSST